jgi:hypothetical protein
VTQNQAEQYRHLARECWARARAASIEEARAELFEAARSWFRLAEEQERASKPWENARSCTASSKPTRTSVSLPMAYTDDPNAPYTLCDGDVLLGTYRTRAEARRSQQRLVSEAGSARRALTIKDKLDRIAL